MSTSPQDVLALPLEQPNDARAATVRDYLVALLREVWEGAEGFSGKRPFGNSGWQYDLYRPLVKAGIVTGTLDDHGYLDDCDDRAADRLITSAIDALGTPKEQL
jgi:hypothetical protein